jgi:integrase/recombinase XerD
VGPREHALVCLLALNGLRVSEVCGADIDDLGHERGHAVLAVTRKRGKKALAALAPRTTVAVAAAIGDRLEGPLLLDQAGARLDRHDAARIIRRLAHAVGNTKRISPHSLRHSFVTLALDAGVTLRDVQDAAGHADPRTTRRYDHARNNLDRHPTYRLAAFLAD